MKGITKEQIQTNIIKYKDQPRKLKHWQVKAAEMERLQKKAKQKADALETLRLRKAAVTEGAK